MLQFATWCEELIYLNGLWCWERLKAGGEGDNRGWECWMASPTRWTWVWVNSGVGDGQGGLACCSPWGCKESDVTEQPNNSILTKAWYINYSSYILDWFSYQPTFHHPNNFMKKNFQSPWSSIMWLVYFSIFNSTYYMYSLWQLKSIYYFISEKGLDISFSSFAQIFSSFQILLFPDYVPKPYSYVISNWNTIFSWNSSWLPSF